MFGHQDHKQDENNKSDVDSVDEAAVALAAPPKDDDLSSTLSDNSDNPTPADPTLITPGPAAAIGSEPAITDQPWNVADPHAPKEDNHPIKDVLSPAGGYPKPASQRLHNLPSIASDDSSSSEDSSDDLLIDTDKDGLAAIKIQALDELYPLIDKLNLSAEERFKTLMMMIQASDNQELVKSAYEAAHKIHDENKRAQALLDIVNEINYFTHPPLGN